MQIWIKVEGVSLDEKRIDNFWQTEKRQKILGRLLYIPYRPSYHWFFYSKACRISMGRGPRFFCSVWIYLLRPPYFHSKSITPICQEERELLWVTLFHQQQYLSSGPFLCLFLKEGSSPHICCFCLFLPSSPFLRCL